MGKFGDSFKRQLGRDTGRFVSNVLFGNKHAAPVRVSHRQEGKERLEKLRYKNEVKLEKLRHRNQMALEREQQKRANAQDAEESHSLTGMVYSAFTPPVENAAAQEPGFDAGFDPEFEPAFEPTEPPAQRQAATGTNHTASPSTPAGNGFMGDVLNIELPDNPEGVIKLLTRWETLMLSYDYSNNNDADHLYLSAIANRYRQGIRRLDLMGIQDLSYYQDVLSKYKHKVFWGKYRMIIIPGALVILIMVILGIMES